MSVPTDDVVYKIDLVFWNIDIFLLQQAIQIRWTTLIHILFW